MNEIQIASKNIQVTPYGIEFSGAPSIDEVTNALKNVMKVDTMLQFYIGDLINQATYQWGEKYDKWEEITGYEYITLAQFAQVSERFPADVREQIFSPGTKNANAISFKHFRLAAPLSDEKALYFLGMVRDGKWSVAKLVDEIKRDKNGGTLPEPKVQAELPDGFVKISEAQPEFAGVIPMPEEVGTATPKAVSRLVLITDWEADLLLEEIEDNPRLQMLYDRVTQTFGG
jgi:hypothetical protein